MAKAEPKPKKIAAKAKAKLVAETKPVDSDEEANIELKPAKPATAKAGKRSAKAIAENEAQQAKQARKMAKTEAQPKTAAKPPRTRIERAGKKYREAAKLIDTEKNHSLDEALELIAKTNPAKFDATVELHVNLSVDPTQADQNVRGTVTLPAGTGKTLKVAAFVEGEDVKKAQTAGADIAGSEEITRLLDSQKLDFDIVVATPSTMPKLGKYAKLLGPKGLMPNPKSGTVTTDVAKAVSEAKAGKVEYRVDSAGIVHLGIGKASFSKEDLVQNAEAVLTGIRSAKPAAIKGAYIKSAHISTTMGPSIKVEI